MMMMMTMNQREQCSPLRPLAGYTFKAPQRTTCVVWFYLRTMRFHSMATPPLRRVTRRSSCGVAIE